MNDLSHKFGKPTDPMDIEIQPGLKVRHVLTADECATAILQLDLDIATITGQI